MLLLELIGKGKDWTVMLISLAVPVETHHTMLPLQRFVQLPLKPRWFLDLFLSANNSSLVADRVVGEFLANDSYFHV